MANPQQRSSGVRRVAVFKLAYQQTGGKSIKKAAILGGSYPCFLIPISPIGGVGEQPLREQSPKEGIQKEEHQFVMLWQL
jgi:hypothetical protein